MTAGWDKEYVANKHEYQKIFEKALTLNPYTDLGFLEKTICENTNRKYAVSVNSGTDALFFSLLALEIKPEDEVLVTDFSWISSASCVSMTNAIPVFCDINLDSYHMSLESIKRMVSPKTKAIVYPHLFGNMSDVQSILEFCAENNIVFIEDACQSIGSSYKGIKAGSIGRISALSFNANKNIAGIAGGGAVVTNDEKLAEKIKKIRVHGNGEMLGYNSKMLRINAEIINHRFKSIETWQTARRNIANFYTKSLKALDLPITIQSDSNANHNYHRYVIRCENKKIRNDLKELLKAEVNYDKPISDNVMYASIYHRKDNCVNSKIVADTILSLPLNHYTKLSEAEEVVFKILEYYDRCSS